MSAKDKQTFVPRPPEAPEVIEARWKKKKQRIEELANGIRRLRVNISRDIRSDNEKTALTALAIAVMDKTGERVGNTDSEKNGHIGITGLQKKNITINGNTVSLDYIGKSGVKHEKCFTDERIAKALKKAIKNSPCKHIFTTSKGLRIKSGQINSYLSDFNVTAKDIRGYASNFWSIQKLKNIDPAETDKKRKKQINKILKQVAEKVGHGRPTLRKHYLVPEL